MFHERTFRLNLVVLLSLVAVLLVLGVRVATRLFGDRYDFFTDVPSIVVGVLLLLAFCALVRWYCVVNVGPEGLRTTDGIGRYHNVKWTSMRGVRNLVGFLWVPHGKLGAALLFPIFLDRGAEFREYVLMHAPEDNPLRAYLAAR